MAIETGVIKVLESESEIFKELNKEIDAGMHLSFIEFSLCPYDTKLHFIRTFIKVNKSPYSVLKPWVFDWCSKEIKTEIIQSFISSKRKLSERMIKMCPTDLLDTYFEYRMEDDFLENYEFELLTQEQKNKYIIKGIEDGSINYIDIDDFETLDIKYKILFIFNNGYCNVDSEIKEWYDNWEKATNRENRIDKILRNA